jgi:hypothetical protein
LLRSPAVAREGTTIALARRTASRVAIRKNMRDAKPKLFGTV